MGILCLPFLLENECYCYDTMTNSIMQIEPALFEVLRKFDYTNSSEVIQSLESRFSKDQIVTAINTIIKMNSETKYFAPFGCIKFSFPFSNGDYTKVLHNLQNDMTLSVTETCNFRCKYCVYGDTYLHSRKHSNRKMSWSTAKQAIDFFVSNSKYLIEKTDHDLLLSFYGGEPLSNFKLIKDCIEYINQEYHAQASRFKYSLTTNAVLLNSSIIETFIHYDFSLYVSLDGPSKLHDRYRLTQKGKPTYDKVIKKIELIKSIDENYFSNKVGFVAVLAPEYDLASVFDYFRANYITSVSPIFTRVSTGDTTFFTCFDMSIENAKRFEQINVLRDAYLEKINNDEEDRILRAYFETSLDDIHFRDPRVLNATVFPGGICLPGLQRVFVDVDGKFHLCEKINHRFPIGSLDEGFDVLGMRKFFDDYCRTLEECARCWAVRLCKDCYITAIRGSEFLKEKKMQECIRTKKALHKNLVDYVAVMKKNPNYFHKKNRDSSRNIHNLAHKFIAEQNNYS